MKIKEIFKSIQGEGIYVGYNQLFIRFCRCNLKCKYCDTDYDCKNVLGDFSPSDLYKFIINNYDLNNIHSISLTGGEPLLEVEFLKEFLPLLKGIKIYLETNATLSENLSGIIDYVDIIACDIKLPSATGINGTFDMHDLFFQIASKKNCFAKIVFDNNIKDEEIKNSCLLAKKYNLPLILQPMMINNKSSVSPEFIQQTLDKFLTHFDDVRLIPQTHKFISVQ